MVPVLILYVVGGLVFAGVALMFMRGEREPWLKSLMWAALIGALWPIALAMAVYELAHTRWI